jgi:hypothetical protein
MNSDNFNESTTGETDSNGQFVVEGKNSDGSDKIKGRHGVSTIGGDTNKEASYRGQAKGREAILQAEVNLKEKKKSDFFAVDIKTAEATISNGENAEGREVSKTTLEILGGGKGKEKEGRARLEQIVGKDGLGTDDKTGQLKITKKFDTLYNPEQLFRGLSVGLSAVKNILDVLTSTIEKYNRENGRKKYRSEQEDFLVWKRILRWYWFWTCDESFHVPFQRIILFCPLQATERYFLSLSGQDIK